MVWLNGRCCRTEHACSMNDEIQKKIQREGEMLSEMEEERQTGGKKKKKKTKVTENKRLHLNPTEFDRSGVHAFM